LIVAVGPLDGVTLLIVPGSGRLAALGCFGQRLFLFVGRNIF
jgi:hypothetical protein